MPEKGTVHVKVIGDLTDLRKGLGTLGREPFKLRLDDKAFSQPLGRITGKLGEFDKSLEASNARVIAFGASAGAIMGVQRALKATVSAAIEVEKSLTDINVILGAGEKSLARFGDQLFKIASNTGQSFKVVATAATELARQGLSVEETLRRTSDALVLTRLSGLDAVSSVESLTASINSFNRVALTSTEIVNKLANVDAAFAVSSADLAEALRRVGSTASDAGVSFDQLIAAVTSAQQVTARGGSVIGNSFKTIFTRLQRPAVLQQLEQLGIKTKGLGDTARPVIGILTDLSKVYDKLASSQRAQISELIGGVFQINIVKAALSDLGKEYSIYDRALATSVSSTNEAIARNEELNKTLSALINKTFANLQKVGARAGEGAFAPAIKNVLGFVNKALGDSAGEKGAEDFGGKVAQGIFKGLGDFLSGPGLVLGASLMLKMFTRLTITLTDAFKTIAAQNKQTALKVKLEKEAFGWLSRHPDILQKIKNGTISIRDAERAVGESIQRNTTELNEQYIVVKNIVSGLMASKKLSLGAGVGSARTGEGGVTSKGASGGLVPTRRERAMEKHSAAELGYAAGGVKADRIKGVGRVIYNSNEDRVQFGGMSSEAIMPPKSSKAGQRYRKGFKQQHGFDPYKASGDMMAGGMVPNFARDPRFKRSGNTYNFAGTLGGIRDVIPRKTGGTSDFERMVKNLRAAGERNIEWDDRFTSSTVVKSYDSKLAKSDSKHMSQADRTGAYLERDMEKDLRKHGGVRAGETFSKKDYKKLAQSKKRWGMFSSVKSGESQEKFQGQFGRAGGFKSRFSPADIMFSGQGKYQSGESKNVGTLMGGLGPSKLADFYRATIGKHVRDLLGRGLLMPQFTEGTKTGRDDISLGRQILGVGGRTNKGAGTLMPKSMKGGKVHSGGWGASGIVPNFARYVFDKDAYLQKYADKGLLQSRLDATGTGSLKELFDYDVMQAGKNSNLTVINAAAGAGKTSLAMGSRKRGKLAYTSSGISKKDQSVVVRATESITAGKDALLNRMYAPYAKRFLTLLPEGEAIQEGRRSRGQTGQYMFGRSAKQTSGAGAEFLPQAAVLQDAVGGKHRTLTRGTGANQPWKKYGGDMPKVHTRPTAVTTGAFSPFTLGHQALLDKMQKTGMPTAASVAGGKDRKHDIGLSVKRKMQLLQEANPQTATVGGGHLPQIFTAPADMPKLGIKKGEVISSTSEGSLAFLGTDRFNESKTGKRGIFDLKEVKRGANDISATKVRGAIQSGDVGSYSKMLPKNVGNFVTGNLGDIQAMQGMMSRREAKKMGGVTSRLGVLWGEMGVPFNPGAKSPVLSPKRKREFPVQAAEIAQLNEQRKKTVSHKWRKRVFPHLGGGLVPNFAKDYLRIVTEKLAKGSIQGFNQNQPYMQVLAQNPHLMARYQELKAGAAGRKKATSAITAGIDTQVAQTYAGKGAKAVFLQNLKEPTVARRTPSTLRHGFDPDILPGVRSTFMGSLDNRWEKLIRGVAFDTFRTIPPNKLKSFGGVKKLMSGLETRGLTKIPVTMGPVKGRVFEEFINAMSPVINRRAHETGAERVDLGNRRIKSQYQGLFTPGMPGTGAEIRSGSLSEKKARQKFGLAGGSIPNFAGFVGRRALSNASKAAFGKPREHGLFSKKKNVKGGQSMVSSSIKDAIMSYITGGSVGLPPIAFAADMLSIHGPEVVKGALRLFKGGSFFKGYGKGTRLERGGAGGSVIGGLFAGGKIPSDLNIASYNKLKWPGGRSPGRAGADKKRKLAELERAVEQALRLSKPYKRSKDAKPWEWDAAGLIPNFSTSPLQRAYGREVAAGVPPSRIRIGSSPRLASGLNPSGLGVYNTLHEPGGLDQGINNARASGLNPKSAGVPNFASSYPLHPLLGTGGSSSKEAAAKVRRGMDEVAEALEGTAETMDNLTDAGKVGGFEKFQNKALQASFILPMVSGQLQQVVGQNTKWGKAVGGLTDGISVAASFIGVGGPWGVAAGLAIGGFMALDKGLKAFNSNVEDLKLESGKLREQFTKTSNGLSSYGDALQQYSTALLDSNSSASLIVRLQDKMAEALKDVPAAFQDQVLAAKNSTELQEKVADGLKEMAKEAANAKFASTLENVTSGERTGFAAFSKRTLGQDWFDIDVFEEIRGSAKKFASDFRATLDFSKLSEEIVGKGFLGGTQEEIVRKLEKEFGISNDVSIGLRDMSNQDFDEFSSSLQLMAQATALTNAKTEAAAKAHKEFKVVIEEQTRKIHLLQKEFQGLIEASRFMAQTFSQQRRFMDDFSDSARGLSRTGGIKDADRALRVSSPFMTEQAIAGNKAQTKLAEIRNKTISGQDKIVSASAQKRRDAVIKLEGAFLKAIEAQAKREGLKEGKITRDPSRQAAITAFREALQDVVRRKGVFDVPGTNPAAASQMEEWLGFRTGGTPTDRAGKTISGGEIEALQKRLAGTGLGQTSELTNEFTTTQNDILNANIKQTQALADLGQTNNEQLRQAKEDYKAQLKQIQIAQDIKAAGGMEGFASGMGDSIMQDMADAQAGMMLGRKMGSIGVMGRGATMAEMAIQRATGAPSGNEWLRNVATRGRQAQLGGMFGLMGIRGQDTGRMARNQADALFKPGRGLLPETEAATAATQIDYSMMNHAHKLALDESEGLLSSIDNKMDNFSKAAEAMLNERAKAALVLKGPGGLEEKRAEATKAGIAGAARKSAIKSGTAAVDKFHKPSESKRRMDLIDTTWDAWGKDEALRFDALIKEITRQVWDKDKPDQFKTLTKDMAESGHPLIAKTADGKQYKNILGIDSLAGLNEKMIDMWETDLGDMSDAMKDFKRMLPHELRDKSYRPQWEDAYSDMQSGEAGPMRAKIDAMFASISKYIDAEAERLTKNRPVPTEAYGSIPGGREMEKRMLKGNRQYSASESARATPRRRNINGRPTWLNSEEMVMPNFAGSGKQAVLTPSMRRGFGMANGHIPNFYDEREGLQDWSNPNYKSGGRYHFSDLEPVGLAGAAGAGIYGAWRYRDWIRAKITPTGLLERRQMMKGLKPLIGSSFSGKEFKEFKKLMKALDYADAKGVPLQASPVVPYGGLRGDTGGGNVHNLRDIAFDAAKTGEDRIKAIKELLNDSNLHKNVRAVKASIKADPARTRWFRKGAPPGEAPLETGRPPASPESAAEMKRLSKSAAVRMAAQKAADALEAQKAADALDAKQAARHADVARGQARAEAARLAQELDKGTPAAELPEARVPPRTPPGVAKAGSWLEYLRTSSAGTAGKGVLRGMSMFDPATTSWANPNISQGLRGQNPWATPPAAPAAPPPTDPNLIQRTGQWLGKTWSKMPSWAKTTGRYASRAAAPFAKLGKGFLPVLGGAGQVGLVGETATGAGGFAQAQQQIYGTSMGEPNPFFQMFGIDTPGFDLGGNVAGSGASSSFATEEERDKFFQGSEIMRASKSLQVRMDMIMRPTRNYAAAKFSEEDKSFYNEYIKKETEKLRNYHDHNMHAGQSWFHRQYGVQENTGVKAKLHDKFLRENYQRYLELKSRLEQARFLRKPAGPGFADGFIPNFADDEKIRSLVNDQKWAGDTAGQKASSTSPTHKRVFNLSDVDGWKAIVTRVSENMGIKLQPHFNDLTKIGKTKIGMWGTAGMYAGQAAGYNPATNMIAMHASTAEGLYDVGGGPGRQSAVGALSNELTHVLQDQFRAGQDLDFQRYSGGRMSMTKEGPTDEKGNPIWQAAEYMRTGKKGKFGTADSYRANTEKSIENLEKRFRSQIRKHGLSVKGSKEKGFNWVDRTGNTIMPVVISGGLDAKWQSGDRRGGKSSMQKLEWESTLNDYLMALENRYEYKFRHSGQKANGYLPNFALQGRPSSKIGSGSYALSGVNMGLGWFNNPFYKKIAMNTPGLMGMMNPSGFGAARSWSNRGAYGDGIAANGSVPNFAGSNSIQASQRRERRASGRSDVYTKYINTPNFSGFATFNGSERGRERAIVRSHPNPRSAGSTPNFAGDSNDVKNAIESLTGQIATLAEYIRSSGQQAKEGQTSQGSSHQLAMSPLNVNVNHSGKLTTEVAAIQNQISLAIENAMKQIAPALWSTIKGPSTV